MFLCHHPPLVPIVQLEEGLTDVAVMPIIDLAECVVIGLHARTGLPAEKLLNHSPKKPWRRSTPMQHGCPVDLMLGDDQPGPDHSGQPAEQATRAAEAFPSIDKDRCLTGRENGSATPPDVPTLADLHPLDAATPRANPIGKVRQKRALPATMGSDDCHHPPQTVEPFKQSVQEPVRRPLPAIAVPNPRDRARPDQARREWIAMDGSPVHPPLLSGSLAGGIRPTKKTCSDT
jgi:hypothetical protein